MYTRKARATREAQLPIARAVGSHVLNEKQLIPQRGLTDTLSAIRTILCANLRFWTISRAIAHGWASILARGAIVPRVDTRTTTAQPRLQSCCPVWLQASSRKSRHSAPRSFLVRCGF